MLWRQDKNKKYFLIVLEKTSLPRRETEYIFFTLSLLFVHRVIVREQFVLYLSYIYLSYIYQILQFLWICDKVATSTLRYIVFIQIVT